MAAETSKTSIRFGPLIWFAMALAVIGIGVFGYLQDVKDATARKAALDTAPPAIVPVETFDLATSTGIANEARIIAQVDFTQKGQIGIKEIPGAPYAYMLPLLPADAKADGPKPDALGVLLYKGNVAEFEATYLDGLLDQITGMGAYGPIVELNGIASAKGAYNIFIVDAFARANATLAPGAFTFEPFTQPRAQALVPVQPGANLILAGGVAILFGVGGMLSFAFSHGKPRRAHAAAVTAAQPTGNHSEIGAYAPMLADGTAAKSLAPGVLTPSASAAGSDALGTGVYSPQNDELDAFSAFEENDGLDAETVEDDDFLEEFMAEEAISVPTPEHNATRPHVSHALMSNDQYANDPELAPVNDRVQPRPKQTGIFASWHAGASIREEIKLSKRDNKKLDADPFMQRLSRLA